MKHVFLILAHGQPAQVNLLIACLLAQGGQVVLHIDKKNIGAFTDSIARWQADRNFHLVGNPVTVNWAGFSIVEATLRGISCALEQCGNFDYLHLLSGQCTPLLSLDEMSQHLAAGNASPDLIECRRRPGYEWRINRFNILGEYPHNRDPWPNMLFKRFLWLQKPFPKRRNFTDDEVMEGSAWWSLRFETINTMLNTVELSKYKRKFRWTRCADEHFFQMLFSRTGRKAQGSGRYIVFDQGAASPKLLSHQDLIDARRASFLFARKVSQEVAAEFLSSTVCPDVCQVNDALHQP